MAENDKDKFEDAAKKAVEREEGSEYDDVTFEETEVTPSTEAYKGLGKATNYDPKDTDSGKKEELKSAFGYTQILMENLPSKGRFYPADMKISIRAARVQEVREFSTVEENNLFDVDDKLNNLLVSCCKVDLRGRNGTYKDILEEDRIFVILSVREMTFKVGENKLSNQAVCKQCDHENSYELRTTNLQYHDEVPEIEKYYHEEERCYVIPTKSSGTLRMAPPKIGVMKTITSLIREKEEKKEKWDKAFFSILPYYKTDWRGFDEKEIFAMEVEFQGWSTTKYSLMYRLAEKMKIGVKQELTHACDNCGAEVTVPITFQDGIKSLFIISDIADELL